VDDLSVGQAADQLGVDRSRVRQLLRAGTLSGRHAGRDWLVSAEGVAALRARPVRSGRPLAPRRAWGLLDLLDGGDAAWLDPVARSHVRAHIRRLAGADGARWAGALRGREDRYPMSAHRGALAHLAGVDGVWPADAATAAATAGADLAAAHTVAEVYVPADKFDALTRALHLGAATGRPDVVVRVPRQLWPFGPAGPGRAALAATLVDSDEWRANQAGAQILNELAGAL
jgi:excisionase family DNA binding protein